MTVGDRSGNHLCIVLELMLRDLFDSLVALFGAVRVASNAS